MMVCQSKKSASARNTMQIQRTVALRKTVHHYSQIEISEDSAITDMEQVCKSVSNVTHDVPGKKCWQAGKEQNAWGEVQCYEFCLIYSIFKRKIVVLLSSPPTDRRVMRRMDPSTV